MCQMSPRLHPVAPSSVRAWSRIMTEPPPGPTELFTCLQQYLPKVARYLSCLFPSCVVRQAIEDAEMAACQAICLGRASQMTSIHRRRWLRQIAYHRAVTITRRRRVLALIGDFEAEPDDCLLSLQREALVAALERLQAQFREVLELRYFDGMSLRAVADRLGTSETAIRRRRDRALDMLREELLKAGF